MALASLVATTEVKHMCKECHAPGGVRQWGEGAFKVSLKS